MLLHAVIRASRANGPGLRSVVFFQGCTLGCRGRWNRETHAFRGSEVDADTVARDLLQRHSEKSLEGVTFSGGEPMEQASSLLELIECLRSAAPGLSFGMFSGYTEPELAAGNYWTRNWLSISEKQHLWQEIRNRLDFAVLGRFNQTQPSQAPLLSSRNQALRLFSMRYTAADFSEQSVEVSIHEDGLTQLTGFPVLGSLV